MKVETLVRKAPRRSPTPAEEDWIYKRGEETDFMLIVLTGVVMVSFGREKFQQECGSFSVMGVESLSAVAEYYAECSKDKKGSNSAVVKKRVSDKVDTDKSTSAGSKDGSTDSCTQSLTIDVNDSNFPTYKPDFSAAIWSDTVNVVKISREKYAKAMKREFENDIPELEPSVNVRIQQAMTQHKKLIQGSLGPPALSPLKKGDKSDRENSRTRFSFLPATAALALGGGASPGSDSVHRASGGNSISPGMSPSKYSEMDSHQYRADSDIGHSRDLEAMRSLGRTGYLSSSPGTGHGGNRDNYESEKDKSGSAGSKLFGMFKLSSNKEGKAKKNSYSRNNSAQEESRANPPKKGPSGNSLGSYVNEDSSNLK